MAATRLVRGFSCSCSSSFKMNCGFPEMGSVKVRCMSKGENWLPCARQGERKTNAPIEVKATASTSDSVRTSEPKTEKLVDFALVLSDTALLLLTFIRGLNLAIRSTPWKWHFQMFTEKLIMDCRFFTMLAVGGSLLGSSLCFFEGCVLIGECYLHYFQSLSQGSAQEHLVHRLIESLDMFLVATAMLVFGTALHVMFVGSSALTGKGSQILRPNFIKTLPARVGIQTIMQAKSKIGQAVIMILQVGMLEKFKTIPLVTGLDLACFAGALFASSATIFLLSKLIAVRR